MGRLERILRELREKLEQIQEEAPAGPGELDLRRLDDDELTRLEALLSRADAEAPRQESKPREKALAGKPNADTLRRHWAQNTSNPPPETAVVGALDGDELREIQTLLTKAQIPEAGAGDG